MGDDAHMNVTIIGTGYVGLTTGLALSYLGHDVTCVDVKSDVVERLGAGTPTIFEQGLPELLDQVKDSTRFQTTIPPLKGRGVVLIAVGTPTRPDGDADLQYVDQAARDVAAAIQSGAELVVVNKSTVPIGSARHVEGIIGRELEARGVDARVAVASNPEFLAEGRAMHDTFYPDRIVIGADESWAVEMLRELYQPLLEQTFEPPPATPRPERYPLPNVITTSTTSAELTKYAANSFLAAKISFINEFAGLAEHVGADVTQVARAIGLDARIGPRFLHAGIGWGGSCFGKDTRAIIATAQRYDYAMPIVQSAIDVNYRQRLRVIGKLQEHLKVLRGTCIGLLGLAFKAGTDDLRDAPAITLAQHLLERGAVVRVHDPVAMPHAREQFPELEMSYEDDELALARGCDAVVVVTEWDQYRRLDWKPLAEVMRGTVVLDARNALRPEAVRSAGLTYVGIGR
jgi:UDPglucose 6-dehydrogenase